MPEHTPRLSEALQDRYRIERELGEGGMATVYLAEDLKHGRQVAIKVLRPELAAVVGAERFLAEIKTTAALQHPHILPLHDSGEADGFLFYVMPYVRGESLRERLDREKQLAVDEAIALTRKVADALDYAHEQGVVHRDIKPANILLSERGEPLVADFGIALAVSQAGGGRITETGLSLGTPHYMAPEQAAGDRDVDLRCDVYALGCVLYEMLAAQSPFAAPTAQAVLARILTEDPRDVRELRRSVPEHVAAVLARALEKLPADRFPDAASLKAALDDPGYRYRSTTGTAVHAVRRGADRPRTGSWARWAAAGAAGIAAFALGGAAVAWLGGESAAPAGMGTVVRMPLDSAVQGDWRQSDFDVSPDGSTIVFASWPTPLQVIELDGPTRRELPGTEPAQAPVFSADGRWIAFEQDGTLGRVSVDGGAPTAIRDEAWGMPSAWTEDGTLYYLGPGGSYRIREGEEPERILDQGVLAAANVRPLKGGRAVLYTESPVGDGTGRVMLRDLERGETRELVPDGFDAWYAPTGHLVYGRSDRSVVAVPFDLDRLEVTGLPQVVLDSVITDASRGRMAFHLAGNGSAVYLRGPTPPDRPDNRIAFVSPGSPETMELPPVRPGGLGGQGLGVSPNGRRLAYVRNSRTFVFDLVTFRDTPLLPDGEVGIEPFWSPDGERIAYGTLGGEGQLLIGAVKSVEPSSPPRLLPVQGRLSQPTGWTPDGARLLVMAMNSGGDEGNWDLMIVDVATGEITPWLESDHSEGHGTVAPDGRWAAYTSDRTGSTELYVRAFLPDPGPAVRVSGPGDGSVRDPAWSPDGGTLYYMRDDSVYAVEVDGSGQTFTAGEPEAVLARETDEGTLFSFSVHPDGRLAVVLRPPDDEADIDAPPPPQPRAYVVVNWLREMLDRIEGR